MKSRLFAALLAAFALPALAQQPTQFQDTSMLKPPAGAKVAVVEFEDLECPACANAAPIVHAAVKQYHVPLVRYDFPLKMHVWSFDAAVYARWMQNKVSPTVADEYRAAVFANQMSIASKDVVRAKPAAITSFICFASSIAMIVATVLLVHGWHHLHPQGSGRHRDCAGEGRCEATHGGAPARRFLR